MYNPKPCTSPLIFTIALHNIMGNLPVIFYFKLNKFKAGWNDNTAVCALDMHAANLDSIPQHPVWLVPK